MRRATVLLTFALAACVSSAPQRWGEWVDPALARDSRLLRVEKVLIACETFDLSVRQLCQDGLYRELQARGVNPVVVPPGTTLLMGRELEGQLAASASAAGANAVFILTLMPAMTGAGSAVSVGVGGFSFGRNGGVGLGVSAPVGGGWGTGFSANGRVTDVRDGRMVWSATFVTTSQDLGAEFAGLTRAVLDSAQGAGLL